MANFLGIFKTVVKDAGIAAQYGSFGVSVFNPALGAIISKIGTAIVQVEAQIPDDNQGAVKSQAVQQDFSSGMIMTQALLAQAGKSMTWDAGKLKDCIDAQTKAFNLYAELAQSIKIVDAVPPTKPLVLNQ